MADTLAIPEPTEPLVEAKADSRDVLVDLKGVGKTFAMTIQSNRRRLARAVLRDLMPFRTRQPAMRKSEFKVLDGIDLSIRRGEAVGLIGHNGAGKTTLLRILAGHLRQDEGEVTVSGSIADLINLTAGFQKTLSGRDNIFIGGALRGKSRRQMQAVVDDIIAFSELGEFIDAPFGTYSQGMQMRLGFSVAVHTDPDVLLIDEILAVGDLRFRNKCLGHLQKMKTRTAFVLVSHGMSQIRDFCDRAIFLDHGKIRFDGDAKAAADLYETSMTEEQTGDVQVGATTGPTLLNREAIELVSTEWSQVMGEDGEPVKPAEYRCSLALDLHARPDALSIGLQIYTEDGVPITSLSNPSCPAVKNADVGRLELRVELLGLRLNPGTYPTVMAVRDGAELLYRERIAPLVIPKTGGRAWGTLQAASRWSGSNSPR